MVVWMYLAVPMGLVETRITLITVACRLGILGLDKCAKTVKGIWARERLLAPTPKSVFDGRFDV
jgi:hypothetical protein